MAPLAGSGLLRSEPPVSRLAETLRVGTAAKLAVVELQGVVLPAADTTYVVGPGRFLLESQLLTTGARKPLVSHNGSVRERYELLSVSMQSGSRPG
jgi:hypothetical protein